MAQRTPTHHEDAPRVALTVRVAMWSARHRVLVLVAWFAVMIGLFATSVALGTRTQTALSSGDARTESELGFQAFEDAGQRDTGESAYLVVRATQGSVTESPARGAVTAIVAELQAATTTIPGVEGAVPILSNVTDPLTAPLLMGLVSGDGRSALIPARIAGTTAEIDAKVTSLRTLLDNRLRTPRYACWRSTPPSSTRRSGSSSPRTSTARSS